MPEWVFDCLESHTEACWAWTLVVRLKIWHSLSASTDPYSVKLISFVGYAMKQKNSSQKLPRTQSAAVQYFSFREALCRCRKGDVKENASGPRWELETPGWMMRQWFYRLPLKFKCKDCLCKVMQSFSAGGGHKRACRGCSCTGHI